jgi:SAM-dependent methyltransferase
MTDWPDIAATYDAVADEYSAAFRDELAAKPFDRSLLDRFAAAVRGRGPVLDVGCGPGHVAGYLSRRGLWVAGVDRSAGMLRAAAAATPGVPLLRADMRALPAGSGSLAGLVAFYAVIHLRRGQAPVALTEFHRVLRPGGSLLLAVHGGSGETGAMHWLGQPVEIRATLFSARELAALARAAGLEVVELTTRVPYGDEYPTHRVYVWARRPVGP